jgi:S-formylglutathione hydrolase FrmB
MKKIFLMLLLFISAAFAQDQLLVKSPLLPGTDTVLVFTPKDYSPSNHYPAVYLLHGWSGNYKQWNQTAGGLQQYADKYGFVIICPDGFYDCWYANSPVLKNEQFDSFLMTKLIPEISSKYSIDNKNVFISGFSMGGHGAITLMLKHPDVFKSAGSMSGILDLTAFPENWKIAKIFGDAKKCKKDWEKNSAIYLVDTLKGTDKTLIFDCGTEDFAYKVNKSFYEKCLSSKIKATFISRPGNHKHEYWHESIKYHLEFFADIVKSASKK